MKSIVKTSGNNCLKRMECLSPYMCAIPDIPLTIASNVTSKELNHLVKSFLNESVGELGEHQAHFDFIIFGESLRSRICDHLKEKTISLEDTIQIEYVEKYPAPQPKDCLVHDDWISAVKTCGKWILTGCYDNTLNIWTTKGVHIITVIGHDSPIKAVSWISCDHAKASFVSCSQDQTAKVWWWNIKNNSVECIYVYKGHLRSVDCVDVNLDTSLFATGSWDAMLKIWSADVTQKYKDISQKIGPESGKMRTPTTTFQGHRECITSVQWMDQANIMTTSWDHTIKIWDLNFNGMKLSISGNKPFLDASFSSLNGMLITALADKNLKLYDLRTNQENHMRSTHEGHKQWVSTVTWSSNEEWFFLSGSYDNQVKLWDYRSPKSPIYDLTGHEDKILDVDWSNPKYLVSGGADNTVRSFKAKEA